MTEYQKWLSQRYLLYQAFTNMWFLGAVWLYFYRIFITDQQVGILDGMAFAIGLLAEVPSGALADKFGRDKLVRLGQILIGGGILLQAMSSDFLPLFIGQAIMMIGVSFTSGADEALFFERLNFKRTSTAWRKLVTRGSQVALATTLATLLVGGWLHTINPRLPWLLTGLAFVVAVFLIWPVKDVHAKVDRKSFSEELGEYLLDIRTGFAQFRLPSLWLYVPIIVAVQGLFYSSEYGLLRVILLDRFHFGPFWGSIVVASSGLIAITALGLMHKYADSVREKRVIAVIAISVVMSLLFSIADIGVWGWLVIVILYVGGHVLQPFMSEIINNNAPDNQRATVLSVASFLRTLPYVGLAPLIGYLNSRGELSYFLLFWALLIFGSLVVYLGAKKRDVYLKV
jgi:hypothetical protein